VSERHDVGEGDARSASLDDDTAGAMTEQPTPFRATEGDRVVPPHPSAIDLHTHTDRSDGLLAPDRLLADAAAAGVRLLAVTDHDTLAGFRDLAEDPGGVVVVPGVEINSVADGIEALWEGELHILGLGVDPDDDGFEAALVEQRARRVERFFRIVTRLRELGMPIDEQVAGLSPAAGASLGRPKLARFLVAAGHAASVDDAMQRVLARGKPGYVRRVGMGPRAAIRSIRSAGGLPVLAHFADAPARRGLLEELREMGLGGLEVYYRHFSADTVDTLRLLAAELHLVPTGGSDYHGDLETYAEAHRALYVPEAVASLVHDALRSAAGIADGPRPDA
jgi:predicted metal-dependent phosphoesterase TrpH